MNAIYNEAERARLAASGIELEGRRERAAREMALYHHLLALPRASLTLSYALNIGGREAAPSPFLVQTMELLANRPGVVEASPLADSFLPPLDATASLREARNRAFALGGPAVAAQFPQAAQGAAIDASATPRKHSEHTTAPWTAKLAPRCSSLASGPRTCSAWPSSRPTPSVLSSSLSAAPSRIDEDNLPRPSSMHGCAARFSTACFTSFTNASWAAPCPRYLLPKRAPHCNPSSPRSSMSRAK